MPRVSPGEVQMLLETYLGSWWLHGPVRVFCWLTGRTRVRALLGLFHALRRRGSSWVSTVYTMKDGTFNVSPTPPPPGVLLVILRSGWLLLFPRQRGERPAPRR